MKYLFAFFAHFSAHFFWGGRIVKLRSPCIKHKHLFCRTTENLSPLHLSLVLFTVSFCCCSCCHYPHFHHVEVLNVWHKFIYQHFLASEFACVFVSCLVVGSLCSIVWFEFYCVTWYKLRNSSGYSGICHWFQNLGGEGRRTAVNSRLTQAT